MTVEVWVKSNVVPDEWDALVIKGDNSWRLHLNITGTVNFTCSGTTSSGVNSTSSVTDGNWHHVVGTLGGNSIKIYIDGVLENVVTTSGNINNTVDQVLIGNNPTFGPRHFNGNMEEVRIWNVARTAEQINGSRNCELQVTEAGLVAYYKFNQGIDAANNTVITSLLDATANANNGTLVNFTKTGTTSNFLTGSPVTTGSIIPSVATITTPVVYTQGATSTALTATVGANGSSLVWYTTATGGTGAPTAPTPSTATVGSTSYWVASTNANGCESGRKEIVVTVNSVAVASCFVEIQTGNSHTLAIADNGTLWSWGFNNYGQLGLGDTTNRTLPLQVGTETNWVSISSENSHTLAIKSDGTLWSWGFNNNGQLGLNDTTNRTSPTQVGTDTDWMFLSTDYEHSLAIKSNGTLWSWGLNNSGQLGLGDTTNRTLPTQVGANTNWSVINAGGNHSIGLKADGTLWTWGNNSNGHLGLGDTATRTSPVQVGTETNWTSINAGGSFSLAVKNNGTLWGCGYNAFGQLGFGTSTVFELSFSQSGTSTDWKNVTTSARCSIATKNDDTIWSFGYNAYYQLGLGTNTDVYVPTIIGTDSWQSISSSDSFGTGIKYDGTIWVWGLNESGQLGLGNATNQTVPVQFSCPAALNTSSFNIDENITLYPNPTNNIVTVEVYDLTNAKLQVVDLTGKILIQLALNSNSNIVNLEQLPFGMYFFKVTSNEGTTTNKIVKN